jgi:hypothetical protein
MAIALITEHNQVFLISENMEKLKFQYPHYGLFENNHAGKMINISQEDFNLLKEGTNNVTYNGTSLVFETLGIVWERKEDMDVTIKSMIEKIDRAYKNNENNAWGAELNAFKTLLNNIDTSSISFPYNGTFQTYLKSQGHSIISTLQIC